MTIVRLGTALFGVTALCLVLGACSSPPVEDPSVASQDLLETETSFADDVTVTEGRLELPALGHEDVLSYPAGKLLVGGPSSDPASTKNAYGFLRRVESVRREDDTIVIMTTPAALTELFKGRVVLSNTSRLGGSTSSPVEDNATTTLPGASIAIPPTSVFAKHLTTGPVAWDIDVGVTGGSVDFSPTITTNIELDGASLQEAKLVATGRVAADVRFGIKVTARNPTDATSDLQTFEKVLYTAPRIRWGQFVGIVPVWESLEARLLVRCGVRVRASVDAGVSFRATAEVSAGGVWHAGNGFDGIFEGPALGFTPRWDADVTGNVFAKCAILPQVTLYAYDAAGPSLTVGPYVEGGLSRSSGGPTTWSADGGFSAALGGKISVFGHDLVDENKTIFDRKLVQRSGTLPF